jgi:hypothetical protein
MVEQEDGVVRENNGACKRESGGGKRIVVFSTFYKLEWLPLTNMSTKIGLELSTMEENMTKMGWERGATRAGCWRERQEWKGWWGGRDEEGKAICPKP